MAVGRSAIRTKRLVADRTAIGASEQHQPFIHHHRRGRSHRTDHVKHSAVGKLFAGSQPDSQPASQPGCRPDQDLITQRLSVSPSPPRTTDCVPTHPQSLCGQRCVPVHTTTDHVQARRPAKPCGRRAFFFNFTSSNLAIGTRDDAIVHTTDAIHWRQSHENYEPKEADAGCDDDCLRRRFHARESREGRRS